MFTLIQKAYGLLATAQISIRGWIKQKPSSYWFIARIKSPKELAEAKPVIRTVSDNRYYALCNMAYNLGVAGLLKFKNMWASIEADDWTGAADHAMDSKWARQVGVRAIRVTSLLRDG